MNLDLIWLSCRALSVAVVGLLIGNQALAQGSYQGKTVFHKGTVVLIR